MTSLPAVALSLVSPRQNDKQLQVTFPLHSYNIPVEATSDDHFFDMLLMIFTSCQRTSIFFCVSDHTNITLTQT